jgi:hypothetical protein
MLFCGLSTRDRNRRNLASAFIGEIAAAMDAVERHADMRRLELGDTNADQSSDFGEFQLPKFTIYEANAGQLGLFNAPLPRELSYFYTRLAALSMRVRMLKSSPQSSAAERRQRMRDMLDDLMNTMELGESLLRDIKMLVSRKQPKSISRA